MMTVNEEKPTIKQIIARTCEERDVTEWSICGDFRSRELVWIRALIATRARQYGYAYSEIGRHLNRDHSTVMNLCGVLKGKRKNEKITRTDNGSKE